MPTEPTPTFSRHFSRWASRVRRRFLLSRALTGLAIGFAVGGAAAALLWWQRIGPLRPWALALGGVGALVGVVIALRRRWSDTDVALYLDARLGSDEAISTAVELSEEAEARAARAVVIEQASQALEKGDPKRARPKVWSTVHALAPVGAAAVVWLSLLPLPPAPPPPELPPGADMVQVANLAGLEKIEALENLDARDPEQKKRLKAMAEEARKLRADLAKGMEKREAQARIAKLRDDVAAERMRFGDKKNRAGLEAAVGKLASNPHTKKAAKALGEGDLVAFDQEMQKLANKAEKEAREAAKEALEEAEKAARQKGAEELAQSLEQQRKAFEERESKAEALRELAKSLGEQGKLSEEAQRDLEEFGESGSPEAQKKLAESLNEALEGLTDEERKRLAEQLKKKMSGEGQDAPMPMTKEQIEDLAKKLDSPEGREELKKQLKELAKQNPSGDAEREKGLEKGEQGGAEAERGLGGAPVPIPTPGGDPGGTSQGQNPGSGKDPSKKPGSGGPGSHKDEGEGNHAGKTDKVPGGELRSKAQAKLNPGAPMHGGSQGRAPARPGETANQAGQGALGHAAPDEVGGVERSEVPEEYREQVGRYFQP